MRVSCSLAPILALTIALAFLSEQVAATPTRVKGREYAATRTRAKRRERARDLPPIPNSERSKKKRLKRRKLGGKGKGKGKGGGDDDFYRFSCEFCVPGAEGGLPDDGLCFSKDMTVLVQGRGRVAMEDLQVGDKVLTRDGLYQPVYAFGHRAPDQKAPFLQIHSDSGEPLEMTQNHLVYLANKANPVRAGSVKVGDVLRSSNKAATIRKIETVSKKGIYAPLTLGGSIVVNGILASSYISIQDRVSNDEPSQSTLSSEYMVLQGSKLQIPIMSHQQYVDMALAPYRVMCRVAGKSFCDTTSTSDGMPLYIRLGMAFNLFSSPSSKAHAWVMMTTILLSSPFYFLEKVLFSNDGGTRWIFLAVLVSVATGWFVLKKVRVRFVARKVKAS